MTHIVYGAATKKALAEALRFAPEAIVFEDPSIFGNSWSGCATAMNRGQSLVCTNHPKRSWFAKVTRTVTGAFKVE